MTIPDFQSVMLPLLRYFGDGQEHASREAVEHLAVIFHLTEAERNKMLPSGRQEVFRNRVAWALSHLKMAGLLESSRRGVYQITENGQNALAKSPDKIGIKYLRQYEDYCRFQSRCRAKRTDDADENDEENQSVSPEESLEAAYVKISNDLAAELLQRLKGSSPGFFEKLVVEVIVKMGYGGSRQDAGEALGRSGDGGIDGIIKEDKLGLDTIYIQAKRWENTVGRPEIQKFVGALTGRRSRKGLFITTSEFSSGAQDYVSRIDTKVVLIEGETLAQLMIDHNVGVSTVATYDLKKIDIDYFLEE